MASDFLPIKYAPLGRMTSDLDPMYRVSGNYGVGTKNIQHTSQLGNTAPSVEIKLGNEFAYTLGSISAQNAVFRVYLDAINNTDTYTLEMFDGNNVSVGIATWTGVLNNPISMGNTAIANILTAVNPLLIAWTPVVQTSATEGYFDFQFFGGASVDYWGYSVTLTSTNPSPTLPIIVQEARDVSLAGDLVHIGKYDLGGDLFIWSTTQHELPSEIVIQGISASPNVPLIRITIANHGLVSGERVVVNGAHINPSGLHEANGNWIVNVIDANNFDLLGSVFSNPWLSGTGFVTINPQGIGQIGVAQRDDNNNTWTYTALLTTKEWNFVTKHQPRTYCENSNIFRSLYWTDNYNVPRVMYYDGAYITNGALNFINPLGEYQYGAIFSETTLILNGTQGILSYYNQLDTGGQLISGNHRYVIRFLTENLNSTLWSDPTNPIPVYDAVPSPAENIQGDDVGVTTRKINQLIVTGIIPNLFKFVELADISYTGGATNGVIVSRTLLTQQPTQILEHSGNETDTQVLDVNTLFEIEAPIRTALNIDSVNNRLVLSNTTTELSIDFSAWTQTWTHNLTYKYIDAVLSRFNSTYRIGEYEPPQNVNQEVGYMMNETYRFGAKFILKDGSTTETYWIDDIIVNDNPINTANPFGDNRRTGNGITGVNANSLTTNDSSFAIVYYPVFTNINWEFQINGSTIKDLIERIVIERFPMTEENIEVIGGGVVVLGVESPLQGTSGLPVNNLYYVAGQRDNVTVGTTTFNFGDIQTGYEQFLQTDPTQPYIFDYPFAEGFLADGTVAILGNNEDYPSAFTPARKYMSFYSPDLLYNNSNYDFRNGDKLYVWGQPAQLIYSDVQSSGTVIPEIYSDFCELTGWLGQSPAYISYDIDASKNIGKGASEIVDASVANRKYIKNVSTSYTLRGVGADPRKYFIINSDFDNPTSPVLHTTQDVSFRGAAGGLGDKAIYMAQIVRQKTNKFGSINNGSYVTTNAYLTYTGVSVASVDVFGGDTFVQKSWLLHRIPNSSLSYDQNVVPIIGVPGAYPFSDAGYGGGIGFYSQNRVNSQMIDRKDSDGAWKYPLNTISTTDWLYTERPNPINLVYNSAYNINDGLVTDSAFDTTLKRSNIQPARIWWSDVKPENSIVDNYRTFLPLNFKDLQLNFGEISQHMNVNGQLMSWQEGHFELQYFDSTGLLVTNAQEAVLGNAGVMPQRGSALSTYGTGQGFSVIKGKTAGGKDMTAWIDFVHGKVVRFDPSQGTTVISDVHQMRSFFNNNLRFAKLHDTPADGEGTHGEWDDQTSEFIWTVRAWKNLDEWSAGTYLAGAEVYYGTTDFHEVPAIYIANVTTTNAPNTVDWTKVELDNNEYYNVYTVAFDKDGFTTFHSFLPKIYMKRGKSLLSPRPVGDERRAYEHYRGQYCVWYTDGQSELVRDAKIDGMSINYDPDQNKHFLAVEMNTEIVPKKMRFFTKQNESYLDDTDFEKRIDVWVSKIKNDSSVTINNPTGRNDLDTSFIFGTYVSADLVMEARKYQKLFNFIMKAKISGRSWRS